MPGSLKSLDLNKLYNIHFTIPQLQLMVVHSPAISPYRDIYPRSTQSVKISFFGNHRSLKHDSGILHFVFSYSLLWQPTLTLLYNFIWHKKEAFIIVLLIIIVIIISIILYNLYLMLKSDIGKIKNFVLWNSILPLKKTLLVQLCYFV